MADDAFALGGDSDESDIDAASVGEGAEDGAGSAASGAGRSDSRGARDHSKELDAIFGDDSDDDAADFDDTEALDEHLDEGDAAAVAAEDEDVFAAVGDGAAAASRDGSEAEEAGEDAVGDLLSLSTPVESPVKRDGGGRSAGGSGIGLDTSLKSLGLSDVSPSAVAAVDVHDDGHATTPSLKAMDDILVGLDRDMGVASPADGSGSPLPPAPEQRRTASDAERVAAARARAVEAAEIAAAKHNAVGMAEAEAKMREELAGDMPDIGYVAELISVCGLPADLRRDTWLRLLDVWGRESSDPMATFRFNVERDAVAGPLSTTAEREVLAAAKTRLAAAAREAAAADGDSGGEPLSEEDAEKLLVFYCRRRMVRLTPALPVVLERFVRLWPTSRVQAFNSFYTFCQRLLPQFFVGDGGGVGPSTTPPSPGSTPRDETDPDSRTRQALAVKADVLSQARAHELVRVLLAFHDPTLEGALAAVWPQWYLPRGQGGALPNDWIGSAFAGSSASEEGLLALWDEFVARQEEDCALPALAVVAMLMGHSDVLIAAAKGDGSSAGRMGARRAAVADEVANLAGYFMGAGQEARLRTTIDELRHIDAITPLTFRYAFRDAVLGLLPEQDAQLSPVGAGSTPGADGSATTPSWLKLSIARSLSGECLYVNAEEVVPHLITTGEVPGGPVVGASSVSPSSNVVRYFVVDCRPSGIRASGRFGTAFHVDVDTFVDERGKAGKQKPEAAAGGAGTADPVAAVRAADEEHRPESPGDGAFSAQGVPLAFALQQLETLKGAMTICIVGVGSRQCWRAYKSGIVKRAITTDIRRVRHVVRAFQKAGFPRVCVMEDGFSAAFEVLRRHKAVETSLVDYNAEKCPHRRHMLIARQMAGGGGATVTLGAVVDKRSRRTPSESPPRPDKDEASAGDKARAIADSVVDIFSSTRKRASSAAKPPPPPVAAGSGDVRRRSTGGGFTLSFGKKKPGTTPAAGGEAQQHDLTSPSRPQSTSAQQWFSQVTGNSLSLGSSPTGTQPTGKPPRAGGAATGDDVADKMRASMSRFGGRLSAFGREIAEKAEKAAERAAIEARDAANKMEERIKEARRASDVSAGEAAAAAAAAADGAAAAPEFAIGDDDDVFGDHSGDEASGAGSGGGGVAARRPSDPAKAAAALAGLRFAGLAKGDEVSTNDWGPSVRVFQATKEKRIDGLTTSSMLPRCLAVSKDRLLVLEAHETALNRALVKSNHHLTEIAKLTFSKKNAQRLSVYYRKGAPDSPLVKRTYHLDEAQAFVKHVQDALRAMT